MRQHPINLLPRDIRARNLAGVRTGRYIACALIGVLTLIVSSIHSRVGLHRAEAALSVARVHADLVIETETRSRELAAELSRLVNEEDRYSEIAHPLEISKVMASVINRLPQGMTLDRIDLDAGPARAVRSPRGSRSSRDRMKPVRVLRAEIAGFAAGDDTIAAYVTMLSALPPLSDVNLDFSRTCSVRGRVAREFRLSFRVPLEVRYVDGEETS